MAVLLGAIKDSEKTIIEKIKRMRSSAPAYDYENYLLKHINNRNKFVRKFVREKFEKSVNPKGNSFLKAQIKKLYK